MSRLMLWFYLYSTNNTNCEQVKIKNKRSITASIDWDGTAGRATWSRPRCRCSRLPSSLIDPYQVYFTTSRAIQKAFLPIKQNHYIHIYSRHQRRYEPQHNKKQNTNKRPSFNHRETHPTKTPSVQHTKHPMHHTTDKYV